MPEKSIEELLNEPVYTKIPKKEGDIRLNINKLIYLINSYGEFHSALTVLMPIIERYDGNFWGTATPKQVIEWAKANKED